MFVLLVILEINASTTFAMASTVLIPVMYVLDMVLATLQITVPVVQATLGTDASIPFASVQVHKTKAQYVLIEVHALHQTIAFVSQVMLETTANTLSVMEEILMTHWYVVDKVLANHQILVSVILAMFQRTALSLYVLV